MTAQLQNPASPWLTNPPEPDDGIRLFCLPYAGGAASIYRQWRHALPAPVKVCPIQLPGRENRITEPLVSDMDTLTDAICDAIAPFTDRPFVLFGHSIGGRIAFELARTLRRQGGPLPRCLIVSGCRAPDIPEPRPLHRLTDRAFIEELKRFSGTPREVLESKELMDMYLPILRADFTVDETYVFTEAPPLECPIFAFGGTADPEAEKAEIESWARHTTAGFFLEMIQGDHFFIQTRQAMLLHAVSEILVKPLEETASAHVQACPETVGHAV